MPCPYPNFKAIRLLYLRAKAPDISLRLQGKDHDAEDPLHRHYAARLENIANLLAGVKDIDDNQRGPDD